VLARRSALDAILVDESVFTPGMKERGMQRSSRVRIALATLGVALIGVTPPSAEAQRPVVYPAKGQSAEQQQKDQAECDAWAKQTTGIDPVAVATAPPPPQGSTVGGGQRLGGAARGAAGGALIGAIAGDAGTGAAAGAVVGTMAGGRRARQQQAQQQQSAEAQKQQTINTYYRAFSACLEGRGYAIK
jgi:outer membrane protein with glycine zipper